MRIPLNPKLESRDGSLARDSKLVNGYYEPRGERIDVYRRPGLLSASVENSVVGQGLYVWQGTQYSVANDTLSQGVPESLVPDGTLWVSEGAIANAGSTAFSNARSGAYDELTGRAFVVSRSGTNFTWIIDSTTCTVQANTGTLAGYYRFATVWFDGFLWLFGGDSGTFAVNNIYKAADGYTFSASTSGSWSARAQSTAHVFEGYIYLVGGQTGGFSGSDLAEVWRSPDGVNWTEVTMPVGFTGRSEPIVFSSGGYLYIAGGVAVWSGGAQRDDIWRSADGLTWTQVDTGVVVATSSIGRSTGGGVNGSVIFHTDNGDAYYSNGGVSWALATGSSPIGAASPGGAIASKTVGNDFFILGLNAAGTQFDWWKGTNNTAGGYSYTLTGAANEPISFTETSGTASTDYLFLKTTTKAWALTLGEPGTLNEVVDADYPAETVPGFAYLDSFFFVMTPAGQIYNSAINNPLSWGALDFVTAENQPEDAVAIAKHQNFVVAFKQTTTQLFYNAANATGSPLAPAINNVYLVGCGAAYSIAQVDGNLFFLSKTQAKGLSVHVFPYDGNAPVEVASSDVQRVLAVADLTTVHAFAGRIDGHAFYVLNLVSEGITLVFDVDTKEWHEWTYLAAQASKSVISITQTGGIATAAVTAHGYADGDPVVIAGADQAGYNGTHNITYVDANTFTFEVAAATVSPATGTITSVGYDEGYFPFSYFSSNGTFDFVQHESNGTIFKISGEYADDNGVPINWLLRTNKVDGQTHDLKAQRAVTIVANQTSGDLLIRHSEDDYQTFSKYRPVDLSSKRPQIRRVGKFRRRSYDFRYTGSGDLVISGADLE